MTAGVRAIQAMGEAVVSGKRKSYEGAASMFVKCSHAITVARLHARGEEPQLARGPPPCRLRVRVGLAVMSAIHACTRST